MTDWTSGYIAELDYTHGFYRELSPSHLRYVLLCKGFAAPAIDQPFTYCELGCGQGYSSNILAAANPLGEFYATDFNPVHINHARTIAQDAGLKNVHFFDDSFQKFGDRTDLPDFDFIVLHGIFSWVSPEVRQDIVRILDRKLKPGGVVYLSYNAMPGCSAFLGLRELMATHIAANSGPLVARIEAAIAFAQQVTGQESQYFAAQPLALERLKALSGMSRNYLAHEYFNQYWQPFFHRDIASLLAEAKLTFAVSANLSEQMDHFSLRPNQLETIQTISNVSLRETLRDTYINQTFRRDVFVRGPLNLTGLQQADILQNQAFALNVVPSQIPKEHRLPVATVQVNTEPFTTIISLLSEKPCSLNQMLPKFSSITVTDLHLAIAILTDGGWIQPVILDPAGPGAERAVASSQALNRSLAQRALSDTKLTIVASPLTGGGVSLDHTVLLFLGAIERDRPGAEFAWETYQRMGLKVRQGDKSLATEEENLAALQTAWETFQTKALPWLKQLQVI